MPSIIVSPRTQSLMTREVSQWKNCNPKDMSQMSSYAIEMALQDAKADIKALLKIIEGYEKQSKAES